MISKEKRVYLRHCLRHPLALAGLGAYILRRALHRLPIYSRAAPTNHYPAAIRNLAERAYTQSREQVLTDLYTLPDTGWQPGSGPELAGYQIPLATRMITVSDLNWERVYDDPEDSLALHRFGWLLRWLSLGPAVRPLEHARDLISSWIVKHGEPDDSPAWETYSASERVANWLLFLCAVRRYIRGNEDYSDRIRRSLHGHLAHVAGHLEYHLAGYNNHLLNNARALYMGGRLLGLAGYAALGKAILYRHVPELINGRGELKEGSAHYQLLLTRSFAEMVWVAEKTKDTAFSHTYKPVLDKMATFCNYLSPTGCLSTDAAFPRIGDLSPDFPVSWFFPNDTGESWWKIWGGTENRAAADAFALGPELKDAPDTGILKKIDIPNSPFVVGTTAPLAGCRYPASHGHLDFGSFTLTDDTGPVLVDNGRFSYCHTDSNRWAVSAAAHNTSLVNGLALVPDCRGVYTGYRSLLAATALEVKSDREATRLSWTTNAIKRSGTSTAWRRDLTVRSGEVRVVETLDNPLNREIAFDTYKHFAPGWCLQAKERLADGHLRVLMAFEDRRYSVSVSVNGALRLRQEIGNPEGNGGWYHPDYGCRVAATSLHFKTRIATPLRMVIRIRRL